ncbi:MAG TPA: helicase-associated domain-containing protein [Propionibacteriaceae bacterium]|nr:helicase-associated domain-containing protein [Propionibacteriaceae bacterium]
MVTAPSEPPRPRTLTEALRAMSAEELAGLLSARLDLLDPVPEDLAELASRSTTSASITRAIDELNSWLRTVAEALAALPDPASVDDLEALLRKPRVTVTAALQRLRERGLLWGENDQLHLVRPVREAFEPYPGGLAPPPARPMSDAQIDAAMDACGAEVRAVLERLLWSPTGAVRQADRSVPVASASSPVERLLSRQLLRPLDSQTVIIPREVAWRLRGGRFTAEPVATETPVITGQRRDPDLVDRAAAGAAFALLHDIELVADRIESIPHKLLRGGGLGSRDVAILAQHLGTDPAHATFVVECAAATRLIAPARTAVLLPTPDYDQWLGGDAAIRWRLVVEGWLAANRFFARSSEAGGHPLGQEAYAPSAAGLRLTVLRLIAGAEPGTVLNLDQLTDAAAWHRPRLSHGPLTAKQLVQWTWREASWLGLSALHAVSSFARVPLQPGQPMPTELTELFPAPVAHFVIQTDLTAVTAGPLEHTVAAELRLLADQESRGGGSVYRFSANSLRRAFDLGWSETDVQLWLEKHSTTEVPQALHYLVGDVGRRYGSIRVGPAGCYVQMADQAQAAALLAHPTASGLGLRSIGPGVLVAAVDADELVPLLRELGHTPAVENGAGDVIMPPPARRASSRAEEQSRVASAAEVAAALLAREPPVNPAKAVGAATEGTIEQLRSATRSAAAVRVIYVTADGSRTERELAPLDLTAGAVRAVDRDSAQIVTIPLARIASIVPSSGRA